MPESQSLALEEGEVISLPFFADERCVVGPQRSGGMGAVYQLLPLSDNLPVLALKTYLMGVDPASLEREARVWISLGTHSNIVQAYGFGMLRECPCIAAEWHDRDMASLNPRQMSGRDIVDLAAGIIRGLAFAHRKLGLIHKDVKPQNVLLGADGEAKLADFGLSDYTSARRVLPQGEPVPFGRSLGEAGGTPQRSGWGGWPVNRGRNRPWGGQSPRTRGPTPRLA